MLAGSGGQGAVPDWAALQPSDGASRPAVDRPENPTEGDLILLAQLRPGSGGGWWGPHASVFCWLGIHTREKPPGLKGWRRAQLTGTKEVMAHATATSEAMDADHHLRFQAGKNLSDTRSVEQITASTGMVLDGGASKWPMQIWCRPSESTL